LFYGTGRLKGFADVPDRARVVTVDEIAAEDWTLNISRCVPPLPRAESRPLADAVRAFQAVLTGVCEAEAELWRVIEAGGCLLEGPNALSGAADY